MPVATQNTKKTLPFKKLGALTGILVAVVAIITGLIAVNQKVDIRNRAAGPSCTKFDARCAWNKLEGVSEYEYTISGSDKTVISGKTDQTLFEFPAQPGIIYTCTVKPLNLPSSCGTIEDSSTSKLCSSNETPTVTPVATATPQASPSATITQNPLTPTVTPSNKSLTTPTTLPTGTTSAPTAQASQSPTPQKTLTPIPTSILIVQSTNTPGPSITSVPSSSNSTISSPTNTPPPTAGIFIPTLTILAIGSFIVILGLLL